MLFICYPKCSTCRKAQDWLDAHGIAYTLRDIKTDRPSAEELRTCRPVPVCLCGGFSTPADFFISPWA